MIARAIEPEWLSVFTANSARSETAANGDRFLVLSDGHRYDLKPGTPEIRLIHFAQYGLRLESKAGSDSVEAVRRAAERSSRARSTLQLLTDDTDNSWSKIMWRLALPIAALNLALLAIPLGAVNPRLGRSGELLIAGLISMLYMNLINLSRAWIDSGKLSFGVGVWAVHAMMALFTTCLLIRRLRLKVPKQAVPQQAS